MASSSSLGYGTRSIVAILGMEPTQEEIALHATPPPGLSPEQCWKLAGADALTAGAGCPPGNIAAGMGEVALAARLFAQRLGSELQLDGPALITQRERLSTLTHQPRAGMTLRGGGQILRAADGWLAINLPRADDWELVPAFSEGAVEPDDEEALVHWVAGQNAQVLAERAALLGLAIGIVPPRPQSRAPSPQATRPAPFRIEAVQPMVQGDLDSVDVVDLSRLWAGPLAGAILASSGARVTKVESLAAPERVPATDAKFAECLNGAKELVRLDFEDRGALRRIVAEADVVIVSSRERALRSLGLAPRPGQLWISISAHGTGGDLPQRVGFGDDAAAEAGAVYWHHGRPVFTGDALGDPVTGLLAATAALGMLASGQAGRVELSLSSSVRWAMGAALPPEIHIPNERHE